MLRQIPNMPFSHNKLFQEEMPREQIIIGVEAGDITTLSEECTPPVEAAIRRVVEDIISLVG